MPREAYSSGRTPREGLQFQPASQSGPEVWYRRQWHADIVNHAKGQSSPNDSVGAPQNVGWPAHTELTDLNLTKELGLFHSGPVLWTPLPPAHTQQHTLNWGSSLLEEEGLALENINQGTHTQAMLCGEGDQMTLDPALREPASYVLTPTRQPDFRNYCQHCQVRFGYLQFLEHCWALIDSVML